MFILGNVVCHVYNQMLHALITFAVSFLVSASRYHAFSFLFFTLSEANILPYALGIDKSFKTMSEQTDFLCHIYLANLIDMIQFCVDRSLL